MPTYTESQIRTAIETVINANTTNAVVFPWWVLGDNPDLWPAILKSAGDGDKVHGYVITRQETAGDRKNAQCVTRNFSYAIWGFHWYDTGTRTSNTDLTFNGELDAICNALVIAASRPAELQLISEELDFRVDLDVFGGQLLHYAT